MFTFLPNPFFKNLVQGGPFSIREMCVFLVPIFCASCSLVILAYLRASFSYSLTTKLR